MNQEKQFQEQKQNRMNKNIPTVLGITITAVLAVAVIGIIVSQYYSREQVEIKRGEEVIEDKAEDWKRFVNEKYGYEIKYPREGNFILTPKGPDGEGADGYEVVFTWEGFNARITAIENARNDKTIDELKETRDFKGIKNVSMVNIPDFADKILIDDSIAYKWISIDSIENQKLGATAVLFNGGDYFYTIQFSCFRQEADAPCLPKFEEKEEEFNLFISTFRFLEPQALELDKLEEDINSIIETGQEIKSDFISLDDIYKYIFEIDKENRIIYYPPHSSPSKKMFLEQEEEEYFLFETKMSDEVSVYFTNISNLILIKNVFMDLGGFRLRASYLDLSKKEIVFSYFLSEQRWKIEMERKGVPVVLSFKVNNPCHEIEISPEILASGLDKFGTAEFVDVTLNDNPLNLIEEPFKVDCVSSDYGAVEDLSISLNLEAINPDFSKVFFSFVVKDFPYKDKQDYSEEIILQEKNFYIEFLDDGLFKAEEY